MLKPNLKLGLAFLTACSLSGCSDPSVDSAKTAISAAGEDVATICYAYVYRERGSTDSKMVLFSGSERPIYRINLAPLLFSPTDRALYAMRDYNELIRIGPHGEDVLWRRDELSIREILSVAPGGLVCASEIGSRDLLVIGADGKTRHRLTQDDILGALGKSLSDPLLIGYALAPGGGALALSLGSEDLIEEGSRSPYPVTYVYDFESSSIKRIGPGVPVEWLDADRILSEYLGPDSPDGIQKEIIVYSLTEGVIGKQNGFIRVGWDGDRIIAIRLDEVREEHPFEYSVEAWTADLSERVAAGEVTGFHPGEADSRLVGIPPRWCGPLIEMLSAKREHK